MTEGRGGAMGVKKSPDLCDVIYECPLPVKNCLTFWKKTQTVFGLLLGFVVAAAAAVAAIQISNKLQNDGQMLYKNTRISCNKEKKPKKLLCYSLVLQGFKFYPKIQLYQVHIFWQVAKSREHFTQTHFCISPVALNLSLNKHIVK